MNRLFKVVCGFIADRSFRAFISGTGRFVETRGCFLDVKAFLDREEVRDSSYCNFLDIDYAPLALGRLAR
jgi:hypothetical protein